MIDFTRLGTLRRGLATSLLLLLAVVPVAAQQIEWGRSFGDDGQAISVSNNIADGSSVYQVGSIGQPEPQQDGFVRKHDFDGRVIWTQRLPVWLADYAVAAAVDDTGVYVAGTSVDPDNVEPSRSWVAKLDAVTGNVIWLKPVASWGLGAIALHPGGLYVGGYNAQGTAGGIFKLDRNGNTLWARTLEGTVYVGQIVVFNDSLYVLDSTMSGASI
jgi:hypothetical protein